MITINHNAFVISFGMPNLAVKRDYLPAGLASLPPARYLQR